MRLSITSARPGPLMALLAPVLLLAALVAACDAGDDDDAEGRLRVVTTLEIFADMTRNVGGDRVHVSALLPPGADPHTFELAPGRVTAVVEAQLVVMNGLGLEENIEDVMTNNAGGPVLELAAGLPIVDGEADDDGDHADDEGDAHAEGNPHLWLDPRLAARYVERIRDALTDIDPAGRAVYESNANAYLEELGALDRELEQAIASIPAERRKLVTFHDAFPYLAERYGLEVVAVVVPSPGREPSARAIADLVETLRREDVPAAFKEPQFNSRVLDEAASEAGVRVLDLLSDAYPGDVDSYVELMRFNLRQLVEGLGDN